jgi:hypothetical protein
MIAAMSVERSVAQVEAELVALRAAAERAGLALACLFSSSDEFEAAIIKERREAGAYGPVRRRRDLAVTVLLKVVLSVAFLML